MEQSLQHRFTTDGIDPLTGRKIVILAFGKEEEIIKWTSKQAPGTIVHPVYKRHEFIRNHDAKDQEVRCVHCGSYDRQSFDLYMEAVAYYKTIPRNTYL